LIAGAQRMITVGRIHGAFGIQGWVRVESFMESPATLLEYPQWWVWRGGEWQALTQLEGRVHGRGFVARLDGVETRDAAERLRNLDIAVPEEWLPPPEEGEFFWRELVGLQVVSVEENTERWLGIVSGFMETGANDVMVVTPCEGSIDQRERLLPYVAQTVTEVDVAAGRIRVVWPSDYDV
jgi:16S rRNA processing protein RimM